MTNRPVLIGCIIFPIIALIGFFIGFSRHMSISGETRRPAKDTWLQINLSGDISEYSEVEDGFRSSSLSVEEICRKLKAAATDNAIKGVILKPSFCQISMSSAHEISLAIQDFKTSRKPVYAHLTMNNQKDYLLAANADKIFMEPSQAAGIMLTGVSANLTFYKNLLDKLGLKINVVRSGKFKGYGEAYTQTALSPETQGNLQSVLKQRYDLLITDLAKMRKLPPDSVKAIFETRKDFAITADIAKENRLIDVIAGRDDFLKQTGITTKQIVSLKSYAPAEKVTSSASKIAVLYLQGSIVSQARGRMDGFITPEKVQQAIDNIKADGKIKAIVLRIDSPGGSALDSEIIYRKLSELKKTVPIIVSMGGTAASGGYYISAASHYIVADPYTVTGSIGVVQLLPDASALSKKIGIGNQTIGYGKYSGAFNFWNSTNPDFIASMQRNSDNVYREFKSRVAESRKLDFDNLDNLAEGRIWSASAAKENGLIDETGTLNTAIKKAASLAKLTTYQTVILPRPKPFITVAIEQISSGLGSMLYQSGFRFLLPDSYLTVMDTKSALSDINQPDADVQGGLSSYFLRRMQALLQPYTNLCILPVNLD